MTAIVFCIIAFVLTLWARTRSRSAGVLSVLFVGYLYGILRANLETAGYFIFDSALLGLYLSEIRAPLTPGQQSRENRLRDWVVALALMPSLLLLLPMQDTMVKLVGFRSAVLFLPFILLGARLEREEFKKVVIGIAALNLLAFAVAGYEFFYGIASLFPPSRVTEIMYRSTLDNPALHRIPATFSTSASYGGTMVFTIPFIGLAISGRYLKGWRHALSLAGLAAGGLGVFLSASRSTAVLAIVAVIGLLLENRRRPRAAMTLLGAAMCVAFLVTTQPRLQRFLSLGDVGSVSQRLSGSVNAGIVDVVTQYPFGNGLGAGGTSLPYFLEKRVRGSIAVENEYARLTLEQGVLGLALWLGFVAWVLVPSHGDPAAPGKLAIRILAAVVFATGLTGTGFLAAIPGTCLLFLLLGALFSDNSATARVSPQSRRPRAPSVRRPVIQTHDPIPGSVEQLGSPSPVAHPWNGQ